MQAPRRRRRVPVSSALWRTIETTRGTPWPRGPSSIVHRSMARKAATHLHTGLQDREPALQQHPWGGSAGVHRRPCAPTAATGCRGGVAGHVQDRRTAPGQGNLELIPWTRDVIVSKRGTIQRDPAGPIAVAMPAGRPQRCQRDSKSIFIFCHLVFCTPPTNRCSAVLPTTRP